MTTGADIRTKGGRTQVRPARAIGYVRVSRVGGRAGESFIAPDVQRETIAAKASSSGLELVGLQEDLDQTGRNFARPGFEAAVAAIEAGEASAIIVAKLTRFSRGSLTSTLRAIERIEAAGGRLIACDLDVDTSTPAGRLTRNVLASIAEFESELIRENWTTARAAAIERGVKISHTANLGYRFGAAHRLEVDPAGAAIVLELYEARRDGASWGELEDVLIARGVELTRTTVIRMLSNRVYLGEARSGELVNLDAHPAIVPVELFDAVQARRGPSRRYDRAVRSMLAGIARCGTCGSRMRRAAVGQKRVGTYACKNRACPAPASVVEPRLDEHVGELLLAWASERGIADESVQASVDHGERRSTLELALADAEIALETFVTSPDNFGLEPALFERGARARQARVDELRAELDALADVDVVVRVRASFRQAWPLLSPAERRQLLDGVVDRIEVDRSTSARRGAQPLDERVRVVLTNGRVLT